MVLKIFPEPPKENNEAAQTKEDNKPVEPA